MALFSWDETYSVNNPEFDRHHQHLYSLVNRLHDAMLSGQAKETMSGILDELISYTQGHFAAEEAFMIARAFPGLAAHKAEHTKLAGQVLEFRDRFRAGGAPITLELMHFLRDWLQNHIQRSDKLYSPLGGARPGTSAGQGLRR
jgi:hemerythrin-like metal-binding protein